MRARFAITLGILTVLPVCHAATYTNQRVTTAKPPASGCTLPPSVVSFRTSDSTVYLYFEAQVASSDSLSSDWLAPDGTVTNGGSWSQSSGTYCFTGAQLAMGGLTGAKLGKWQARVYDGGAPWFAVPFTVSAPNGVPQISSVTPASVVAGATGFSIYANTSSAPLSTAIAWNGSSLATSALGPNMFKAAVPAANVASPGQATITAAASGTTSRKALPFTAS